jgi:DNA invertase Pin-like site-specific DNA recombinase
MLIGYARVSTRDQNLDLQLDKLREAGCEKIFSDKASGVREDRPGLAEAIAYARSGDTLTVWKLDRLGRTMKSLIRFVDDLRESGVEFKSINEGLDTSTPMGRFTFHILGALAQMEAELVKERTMAGLQASRARGKLGGRPKKITPDQLVMARTLMTNPDLTMEQIARQLGVGKSTLYRELARKQPGGVNGN